MISTMNLTSDLPSLKRALERAVDVIKAACFAKTGWHGSPMAYFHANAGNLKTFERRVAEALEKAPELATDDAFAAKVAGARALYDAVQQAAAADKTRLAQKRAERAARQQQREELGVDLRKVDERASPETFKALVGQLDEVRAHYTERLVELFNAEAAEALKLANDENRGRYARIEFRYLSSRSGGYQLRSDLEQYVAKQAAAAAADTVAGFAAKMAGKVDREKAEGAQVVSASIATGDLWAHSTLTVRLSDDTQQVWHTQMIVNHSCRGKFFNQWPTRKVG